MLSLDGSIVNVAIPTLIHSMGASYDQVLWVIDGYLLLFSVLLITTGTLGDIFGYRLLAARLFQGVGGAVLFPQVISSILTIFPPHLRGRAFGLFGAIVGFAPPVRSERRHRLDLVGVALATAGLSGVVFGLIEGERYDRGGIAGPISITSVIVAGVALLTVFVLRQHRQRDEPLMPLSLFRARNFAVGNWVGFVFQLGMIGIMFVLVLYLQMARGYSALETGLVVLPNAVLTAVGSMYAGRLSDTFGAKYILLTGMTLLAVGLLVLVAMVGGLSAATTGLYERVTADRFATGFVNAMQTALVACAVVLVTAALCCFLFSPRKKPHKKPTAMPTPGQRAETTPHD
ncbi:hypothetical protein Z951_35345 [Streptomyces sp. PRh5]|uniref:MFS transporter n=1 Tax=Streptomyces sp. PRh5 TaxID=1158056 RepID=UPI000449F7DC|nr:MFS transporter [Streptomyces sp. PRh5]EXU63597.1 hypothetical protein Z951_35345 [Streptomyces sp. PRh5]